MADTKTQSLAARATVALTDRLPIASANYATATITGATAANPVVITAVGHGFTTGDKVYLHDLGGMVEVNGSTFTITVIGDDSFSLDGEDGTAHTAYTSGGTAIRGRAQYAEVSALNAALVHGNLAGLTTGDPHTQYAFLAGRAGGQTYIGGTAAGESLTAKGTGHATGGPINLQSTALQIVGPAPGIQTTVAFRGIGLGTAPDGNYNTIKSAGHVVLMPGSGDTAMIKGSSVGTSRPLSFSDAGFTAIATLTPSANALALSGKPFGLPSYTDATRPAAGAGPRLIFNSDDGNLNIDDGTNWILPDGTVT